MTDLCEVLPDFDVKPYSHLFHSLDKNEITVADLITLDPIEIARRCPLPLRDLRSLVSDIVQQLQRANDASIKSINVNDYPSSPSPLATLGKKPFLRTLDTNIDACLGGGFPPGYVSEIVGESAAGKTQFALSLLLSVQLPSPHGLGKSAIYISTEAPLNTGRLHQMLEAHPEYQALPLNQRPSMDRIYTLTTNDLETQERVINHQLPIAIQRFDVGLIIVDSIAANFRAEHETKTAKDLADRAAKLTRIGTMLRRIAIDYKLVVVTTNQVSDRFDNVQRLPGFTQSSSPIPGSSSPLAHDQIFASSNATKNDKLRLDHQQRFFTGWGMDPTNNSEQLKNPALGLAWTNQISARIVLKIESERIDGTRTSSNVGNIWKDKKKRRFLGVVFAPWTAPTVNLLQYEIKAQGPVFVTGHENEERKEEYTELLDPGLWLDGSGDDVDFL